MSEQKMVALAQEALQAGGVDDQVVVAGQFLPRGQTGGLFAGGTIGGGVGDALGGVAGGIGVAAGSLAGMKAANRGLPSKMLVAVSANSVYGFDAPTRHSPPRGLVFKVDRAGLTAKVHQRINVRVLELIDSASGARIELEGNRIPVTHSGDVIKALTG